MMMMMTIIIITISAFLPCRARVNALCWQMGWRSSSISTRTRGRTISALRAMFVGGAAMPLAMIDAFEKRHGLAVVRAWGRQGCQGSSR
jgi:hypothetical protein